MDQELRDRIQEVAETNALLNAVKHDSEAQVDAIMGPMMGEYPDFRPHGDQIPGIIAPVIERVNEMSAAERRDRLEELAPEKLADLEAEDEGEDHPLPDLPNVDAAETVRMRVAPNPNGPWHIGHARMPAVIGTYAERYDGSFLCRFDDTDPEVKRPDLDAYDEIVDAIEYLGFEPAQVITASDRLDIYYGHARNLIGEGGAYTCSCGAEEFSELKNAGEACPHREKSIGTVHSEFGSMLEGEYSAGEMVLRVKTDIKHKNPALRDFVAFRMVDTPHPRDVASEERCWPMLDFQSAVDDYLTDITHIIRGIDLQDSAKRQQFIYDYFDWEYPEVVHWGHVQVDAYDVTMSTSTIKSKIEAGELTGWEDPRAPTIASLRRRGIRGEALVNAMVELGTSTSNVDLAMSSIYAANRDLIDEETDRAFFVREEGAAGDGGLVELPISDAPAAAAPPRHPNHEERGTREIPIGDAVVIEQADLPGEGERVWLKGLGCVRYDDESVTVTDNEIDVVTDGPVDVVHWAPADGPRLSLRTPDGDVTGIAEPEITEYDVGEMVQFERVGFARLDAFDNDGEHVSYFAHS
jgi:glutamyl-tRNA synthetase